jgi:transcriptional regulator with XRE-family HTH domain
MQGKISIQGSAQRRHPVSSPIGARIRQLREQRGLTQGDIEEKTGLMRCYISRVENGFKVPSLETLEKFAAAFDLPLYRLFYNSSEPPPTAYLTSRPSFQDLLQVAGKKGPEARFLRKLSSLWTQMGDLEHQVLLDVAGRLATRADEAAKQQCLRVRPGRKCRTTRMQLVPARGKHYREQSQTADAKPTEVAAARDLKSFPHPILDGT